MDYKDLTAEQREKARACKTPEEMLELAQEEGYDLSDDELEAVSGGWGGCSCVSDGCDFYDTCWKD